ncbi:carbohydrate ABC transporter permease [Geochorda subterranea]|uniref:Carbohydrate ABC transporter permease n=1 Tax=Geochorda subterranea TaxID=3109564 RepID=A0ABZ1BRA7_9FIRM|nr:carbohydrate ABC transporter permease [Limnochorda sp. LNt]WRP15126.1 carbohydrate ABC transporter permease [Limnochorda sp. LNt]
MRRGVFPRARAAQPARRLAEAARWAAIALLVVWVLGPFGWGLLSALTPPELLYRSDGLVPPRLTADNFRAVGRDDAFRATFANSVGIGVLSATLTSAVACAAGWGAARFPGRFASASMAGLLVTQLLNGVLVVVPLFVLLARVGLTNTWTGLVLSYAGFTVPFCTLLLRSLFANFPAELEHAALIDGCTRLGAFWRVTLPLSLPGLVAAWLFAFVHAWNDLLYALVLSRDLRTMTVAVHIHNLAHTQFAGTNWSFILAEGVVAVIPAVAAFLYLQRYMVRGLTQGALTG